jgi:hypothetical protein
LKHVQLRLAFARNRNGSRVFSFLRAGFLP